MQQGEEYQPMFQAAQICRTSGNSAECFNAIQEYAQAYSQGQLQDSNPRQAQKSDDETRFGYDLNVIDHKLIAGLSRQPEKRMQVLDPNNSGNVINIDLPKIRREEEPSLHQNRSNHYNQAFHVNSIPSMNDNRNNSININLPSLPSLPPSLPSLPKKPINDEIDESENGNKNKNMPRFRNISDSDRETYAFLLFLGIFIPVLFIILVIGSENFNKQ